MGTWEFILNYQILWNGVSLKKLFVLLMESSIDYQKQPPRGVLKKRCSENMQQIYRTPMSKCDFNKVVVVIFF